MNLFWLVKVLVLTGVLLIVSMPASARDDTYEKQMKCVEHINQRTAATVAGDFEELARLSERYLITCKNIFGDEDYSTAYKDLTYAYFKLGNSRKAVSIGEACIKFFYSNSGCHMWRIESLLALKRVNEAKVALERTEKLIMHLIELRTRELQTTTATIDLELLNAKLNELRAQKAHAESIRRINF